MVGRSDKLQTMRTKEDSTMEMLRNLAQQNFGPK